LALAASEGLEDGPKDGLAAAAVGLFDGEADGLELAATEGPDDG
jgi:hypothetical protein